MTAAPAGHLEIGVPQQITVPEYRTWRQAGGYFDGDGSVVLRVNKFVLDFDLQFSDNFRPQLEQLQSFLRIQRVNTGLILKNPNEKMYVLMIYDNASLVRAAKKLIPFCSKKRQELQAALDYMAGRITATEAVQVFNQMVTIGERTGRIRDTDIQFTRDQALQEITRIRAEATTRKLSKLTFDQQSEIQSRHLAGETAVWMARDYNVSTATISKAINGGFKRIVRV